MAQLASASARLLPSRMVCSILYFGKSLRSALHLRYKGTRFTAETSYSPASCRTTSCESLITRVGSFPPIILEALESDEA